METTIEQRKFRMHPKLLLDVIRRQAGTLSKGILEGVMNSLDAKASRVDITVASDRVVISDNGAGFPSRDHIEKFFEVFGQPHDESEGKIYGTFRMGRGQLFSFGANVWRSGEYRMVVDIAGKGLDYDLQSGLEVVSGCQIEIALYEVMTAVQQHEMIRSISQLVRYAEKPIFVNGTQVNTPASGLRWQMETGQAYFKITPGGQSGIEVFNLGVHVATLSSWDHGASGTIISRENLEVNFARNDIMSTCPVWRKIKPVVKELSGKEADMPKRMSPTQRASIWRTICNDIEQLSNFRDHKLFVDSNGSLLSYSQLERRTNNFGGHSSQITLCFADAGTFLADRIMQANLALVLDRSMVEISGAMSEVGFAELLNRRKFGTKFVLSKIETLEAVLGGSNSAILPESELTASEKYGLGIAERIAQEVVAMVCEEETGNSWKNRRDYHRTIRPGVSDDYEGWTDGNSYIAIERGFLDRAGRGIGGSMVELTNLIMHEFCHRTSSVGDHEHDFDFYKSYHEMTRQSGRISNYAQTWYEQRILVDGKRRSALLKRDARRKDIDSAKVTLNIPSAPPMPIVSLEPVLASAQ